MSHRQLSDHLNPQTEISMQQIGSPFLDDLLHRRMSGCVTHYYSETRNQNSVELGEYYTGIAHVPKPSRERRQMGGPLVRMLSLFSGNVT
jgi:hypothetical protein